MHIQLSSGAQVNFLWQPRKNSPTNINIRIHICMCIKTNTYSHSYIFTCVNFCHHGIYPCEFTRQSQEIISTLKQMLPSWGTRVNLSQSGKSIPTYLCVCIYGKVFLHIYVYVSTCTYPHFGIFLSMGAWVKVWQSRTSCLVCICICICACNIHIHVYVCIYIHRRKLVRCKR